MTLSNLSLKQKLTLSFTIPIVAIFLIAIVVYQNINSLLSANHWVDHTHKVIKEGDRLLSNMVDMETGMRGFLVAGKEEFLEPYHAGKTAFNSNVGKLKNTVRDNPTQVKRLTEIEQLKDQWLTQAAEKQINLREEVNLGESARKNFVQISSRIVGKTKFDALRASIAKMNDIFINNNDLKGQFLLNKLLAEMVNQETGQRGFLLTGKDESLEPYNSGKKNFSIITGSLVEHFDAVRYSAAELRGLLKETQALANDWQQQAAQPEIDARRAMNEVTTTLEDITTHIEKGAGKRSMDTIRIKVNEFIDAEQKLIIVRSEEAEGVADMTMLFILLSGIISALLVAAIAFYIIKNIFKQLGGEPAHIAEISNKIASGDLTLKLDSSDSRGIYESMSVMNNRLREMLANMSSTAQKQSSESERLSATAEQNFQNVQQQHSATDQVATAMEELHATASETASNTELAATTAEKARQLVDDGNEKADLVAAEVRTLSTKLDDATKVIQGLSDNATSINDILDVIKGIADQTNLLALNAAIEAARAGEQGRGFAVVADEVRSLAQNTQNSTLEIETMINQLQSGASASVESMNIGLEQASNIVNQTSEVVSAFDDIKQAVTEINDMNMLIANATKEQQQTSNEVNKSILDIRELSQQTEAGTSEITSSSVELKNLTSLLNDEVHKFKV